MSKKLYIGNLSFKTTEGQLVDLFSSVGEVADVKIVKDKETSKSRGFAFVEMADDEKNLQVISEFDGREFMERAISVKEAIEPERKSTHESVYTGGKKLYVGNLSYNLSSSELTEVFNVVGKVKSVKIVTDRETGKSNGYGFVEMETPESAKEAVEKLNNKDVGGRNINVNSVRDKK